MALAAARAVVSLTGAREFWIVMECPSGGSAGGV